MSARGLLLMWSESSSSSSSFTATKRQPRGVVVTAEESCVTARPRNDNDLTPTGVEEREEGKDIQVFNVTSVGCCFTSPCTISVAKLQPNFFLFSLSDLCSGGPSGPASPSFTVGLNILRKVHFPLNMKMKLLSIVCSFHIIISIPQSHVSILCKVEL